MYQFAAYSENRKTLLKEDNFYAALRVDELFKANDLPVVVFIVHYFSNLNGSKTHQKRTIIKRFICILLRFQN